MRLARSPHTGSPTDGCRVCGEPIDDGPGLNGNAPSQGPFVFGDCYSDLD
jgi:hypothetical protein